MALGNSANDSGQYQRLTTSGQVKKGSGLLCGFIVASGTPTIQIWDSLTAAGNIILNTMQTVVGQYYKLPAQFTTGCFATITGIGDITFIYN